MAQVFRKSATGPGTGHTSQIAKQQGGKRHQQQYPRIVKDTVDPASRLNIIDQHRDGIGNNGFKNHFADDKDRCLKRSLLIFPNTCGESLYNTQRNHLFFFFYIDAYEF